MTKRRPSPPVCVGCYRPHVRLDQPLRLARRADLIQSIEWAEPPLRKYVERLYDHLTIGRKVSDPAEDGQRHPAPEPPKEWTATELEAAAILAIGAAFGV